MDIHVLGNVQILIRFVFQSGLIAHVVRTQLESKRGATVPFATFVVLALSRALIGKPLSGKKFMAEKVFRSMLVTLNSEEGRTVFDDLVAENGNGVVAEDDPANVENE